MKLRWGWAPLFAVGLLLVGLKFSGARGDLARGPIASPNPDATPPETVALGGTKHVRNGAPAELLVFDSVMPNGGAELLWLAGQPATSTPLGPVALDAAGGPVRFDQRLRAERLNFRTEGRMLASVAWDGGDGFWVSTREGGLFRIGSEGEIVDSTESAYDFTELASTPSGTAWAVRSPAQFSFPWGREPEPLFRPVRAEAPSEVPARRPGTSIFVHLVNAGRIVPQEDGTVFYAPFIRDEVIKFGPDGDTLWVSHRGLTHGVEEPSFEIRNDEPLLDYAPVNLGMKAGPDGFLYVLSTPGETTNRSRLDVIDKESGVVVRTGRLPTAMPTVAVAETGRVYLLDEFRLLTGVAAAEREPIADFELERMGGGTLSLADLEGRVTLINFWASWCEPCKVEMPALDSLAQSFDGDEDFGFVAISDDVNPADAEEFIDERGFEFTVLHGRGKMRAKFHYFGLPFTILVDRQGRMVDRWIGFAGEQQVSAIRAAVRAELDRGQDDDPGEHRHRGGPAETRTGHGGHQDDDRSQAEQSTGHAGHGKASPHSGNG